MEKNVEFLALKIIQDLKPNQAHLQKLAPDYNIVTYYNIFITGERTAFS